MAMLSALLIVLVMGGGEYADRRAVRILRDIIRPHPSGSPSVTWDEKAVAYEHLLALEPADTAIALQYGKVLSNRGGYGKALAVYEFALACVPDNPDLWERKGETLWALITVEKGKKLDNASRYDGERIMRESGEYADRFDEMLDAYRRAIRLDPRRGNCYRDLINHAETLDRVSDVLALYKEAQVAMPETAWVWSEYGRFLQRKTDRQEEGLTYVDRAVRMDTTNWESWSDKAAALGKAGRVDEAVQAWDMAIELNKDKPSTRSWHRFLKAQLLMEYGRAEEAEPALLRAIRADHQNDLAWYDLAQVQRYLKRTLESQLQSLDSALASMWMSRPMPLYSDVQQLRSAVLKDLGRRTDARAALDSAETAKNRPVQGLPDLMKRR